MRALGALYFREGHALGLEPCLLEEREVAGTVRSHSLGGVGRRKLRFTGPEAKAAQLSSLAERRKAVAPTPNGKCISREFARIPTAPLPHRPELVFPTPMQTLAVRALGTAVSGTLVKVSE